MLKTALNDPKPRVVYFSSMLDHIDFNAGRALILRATNVSSQEVRLTAYEMLGRSGGKAEIKLLSAASSAPVIRWTARRSRGRSASMGTRINPNPARGNSESSARNALHGGRGAGAHRGQNAGVKRRP